MGTEPHRSTGVATFGVALQGPAEKQPTNEVAVCKEKEVAVCKEKEAVCKEFRTGERKVNEIR